MELLKNRHVLFFRFKHYKKRKIFNIILLIYQLRSQIASIREAWKRRDEEANKPKQLKRPKPEDKSENESRERLENGNKSNKSKRLKYDREDNNENDKKSHRINEDTG